MQAGASMTQQFIFYNESDSSLAESLRIAKLQFRPFFKQALKIHHLAKASGGVSRS
jgi:hypothetical protein